MKVRSQPLAPLPLGSCIAVLAQGVGLMVEPCLLAQTYGEFYAIPTFGGGGRTEAYGVNNQGQVVGVAEERAFIWDEVDGWRLLEGPPGWCLSRATDINDKGWIVGFGYDPQNHIRGFLLVPEPATLALLALGSLGVLRRRRK